MKHETRKLALIVVYLWLLFGLFALHDMLIRRRLGLDFEFEGFAIINALVLGKVMLIAEDFNFGAGRKGKPLIYPILRQAALFALLFMAFHALETAVVGLIRGSARASGVTDIGGGGIADLMTVTAMLFVALVPYFAFRNLTLELGWPVMRRLLFTGGDGSETNITAGKAAMEENPETGRAGLA
nr:hypothetical protein [uncultured Rhodopila sp.]